MLLTKNTINKMSNNFRNDFNCDCFERFGDDLCQLLLSYLSINDKIKFECISKQWQRLVFNEQNKLFIESKEDYDSIKISETLRNNVQIFENLIKKLKFLEVIQIHNGINDRMIYFVSKYCKNLKKIYFIGSIFKSDLIYLGLNCGQSLRSVIFLQLSDSNQELRPLLSMSPNLKKFKSNTDLKPIISQFMPKLEELYVNDVFSFEQLKTFSDLYFKQIKELRICLNFRNHSNKNLNNALKELSRFKNLESLRLEIKPFIDWMNNKSQIDCSLIMIANNCKKLKNFDFALIFNEFIDSKYVFNRPLFQIFGKFNALEVLNIRLIDVFNGNYHNFESLKNCQNLKELNLGLIGITDEISNNIELYLPKLQKILLICQSHQLSDQFLRNLSKLNNLSQVFLSVIYNSMTDSGICDLFKNSPKMTKFINGCNLNVSQTTIDTLIQIANNNPKVKYELKYGLNSGNLTPDMFSNFVIIRPKDSLPPNLEIGFDFEMLIDFGNPLVHFNQLLSDLIIS